MVLLLSMILLLSWSSEAVWAEESLSKISGVEETLQEENGYGIGVYRFL